MNDIDLEPVGAYHMFDQHLSMGLTQKETLWLVKVQERQDDKECWADAIKIADEEVYGV